MRLPIPAPAYRLPFVGTYAISEGPGCGDHTGPQAEAIDYRLSLGTPIYATDAGVVTFAGVASGASAGFGRLVRLAHIDGSTSYYAHLAATKVAVGALVSKNTLIGLSGKSGSAPQAHLHFQILNRLGAPVSIRALPTTVLGPCAPGADGYAVGPPL
jgi:murein DD-endopeptidase MepM/ murein hydrolase activator NlpD